MAALLGRFLALLLLLLLFHLHLASVALVSGEGPNVAAAEGKSQEEEFTEELLLKPLQDRKVLAHFHFESTAPSSSSNGRHHHLFPKAIAQLVHKFHIRELELSFTQGRWNYDRWGGSDPMSSSNVKPPGVELWALFDIPAEQIDMTWKNLSHALSGLFCASINFLESSSSYSNPSWAFRSDASNIRYGALPREAVCTENITPWLKLLPCRDKSGIASLLDRSSIYKGYYHSQRLRIFCDKLTGLVLEQTLTVVLQPIPQRTDLYLLNEPLQPSWSLSSIFKKKVSKHCVLAKSSRIFLELENGIVAKIKEMGSEDSWSSSLLDLSFKPDRVIRELTTFPSERHAILYEYVNNEEHEVLDVGIKWKLPLSWSSPGAPFQVSRFLMGSGNERGLIAVSLQSIESESFAHKSALSQGCKVQAVVFQVVPWYVKVYYHTLKIIIDGKPQTFADVVEKIKVTPSEDKLLPGTLELILRFPCTIHSLTLTLEFDKGFLHIDEYPPDANQGFDIPSALITFPDFHSNRSFPDDDFPVKSPLLRKFQEKNVVKSYTEVLLVPLTTPDFSMPYNVITFTCTVLALYFGSLLNVLRRRVGEEERLLNSKASAKRGLIPILLSKILAKLKWQKSEQHPSSSSSSSLLRPKLFLRIIVVAVIAIAWHYFWS